MRLGVRKAKAPSCGTSHLALETGLGKVSYDVLDTMFVHGPLVVTAWLFAIGFSSSRDS